MNVRSGFFAACYLAATTGLCLALTACAREESAATEAYADYQAAAAAGDWQSARTALLGLVADKDDVAEYWRALGTVQIQLGAYSDAYYAFMRADELERGNPQTLAALTQLALLGGDLHVAERHAKQLALIAPSDPAVTLTFGFVALRRLELDEAERRADDLLATSPTDSTAPASCSPAPARA